MKIRIRYAKRGRLRFTSHRDFARAFERALRRARVPMAYSAGFTPHPKISYAGASPTGAASEAEYLEIGVVTPLDLAVLQRELDTALPTGFDILQVVPATGGSLADRIDASIWRIELLGVAPEALAEPLAEFLAADTAPVERLTKNGIRIIDARSAIVHAAVRSGASDAAGGERYAILELVVRHTTPVVRPDDVLKGMRLSERAVDLTGNIVDLASSIVRATRIAQGVLRELEEAPAPAERPIFDWVADPLLSDHG